MFSKLNTDFSNVTIDDIYFQENIYYRRISTTLTFSGNQYTLST